jgi:hypothetical protein
MNSKQPGKSFFEMTNAERAEATREFDEEFVIDKCRPLTAAERARWEAAKRKKPGTANGRDLRTISVAVERKLLAQSDALAKRLGITRARLIARGLKAVLAAEGEI